MKQLKLSLLLLTSATIAAEPSAKDTPTVRVFGKATKLSAAASIEKSTLSRRRVTMKLSRLRISGIVLLSLAAIGAKPRQMPHDVKVREIREIAESDRQDFLTRSKEYTKQHSKRRLSERLAELRNLQAEIILPKARAEETAELRAEIKSLRAGKLIPAPLSRTPRPGEIGSLLARSMTIVKILGPSRIQFTLTADDLERGSEADNGPAAGWTFIEDGVYTGDLVGLLPGDQLTLAWDAVFVVDRADAHLIRIANSGDLLSAETK